MNEQRLSLSLVKTWKIKFFMGESRGGSDCWGGFLHGTKCDVYLWHSCFSWQSKILSKVRKHPDCWGKEKHLRGVLPLGLTNKKMLIKSFLFSRLQVPKLSLQQRWLCSLEIHNHKSSNEGWHPHMFFEEMFMLLIKKGPWANPWPQSQMAQAGSWLHSWGFFWN